MTQRILLILGHPSSTSFCSAIASTYIQAATIAGHEGDALPWERAEQAIASKKCELAGQIAGCRKCRPA